MPTGDWREETLEKMRKLILAVDKDIVEENKWFKPSNPGGVPTWNLDGIICTGETYKDYVKLTFMKGGALEDPKGLFNAGQAGATRRAIDIRQGDKIDGPAFKALVKQAIALNGAGKKKK